MSKFRPIRRDAAGRPLCRTEFLDRVTAIQANVDMRALAVTVAAGDVGAAFEAIKAKSPDFVLPMAAPRRP